MSSQLDMSRFVGFTRHKVIRRVDSTMRSLSRTIDTDVDLDVLEIAKTWSFWDALPPSAIARSVALPDALVASRCLVIQGVRRCGKSTLLQQLVGRYGLDPTLCAFLNLEDPRLSNALSYQLLDALVATFRQRHPDAGPLTFFLDEIQVVDGWQRWLRSQLDSRQRDVFVITGSNATMLSGELSTALTGRHLTAELFPFDLQEFRAHEPDATLERYLDQGGFPEPVTMPDGDRLLRQYFHDIVERDIRERVGARSSRPVRQVIQMTYEAAGSEMSLRRIAGAAGIAVETAARYLEACESAYMLFSVPFFAFSERKRASRNHKYYPVDTGLRRVVVTKTGADRGKALECAVHLALRRRYGAVNYWRDKGEVDFVIHHRGRIVPLQVTWDDPTARHERALEFFYEQFPQADEAIFVTAANFEALFASDHPGLP